tara:strand:- start:2305 stop:2835 length:531 start_codon:yes stop_codon:yes gene_type:complete
MSKISNKTKTYFLINFFLVFSLYNCGQNKNVNLVKDDFSIEYPSYFQLDESGTEGSVFILKTKFKEGKNSFVENVNLVIQDLKEVSSKEYFSKVEKEIKAFSEIIESKEDISRGKKYLRLVFQLDQDDSNFTIVQHFYIVNEKVYILTFSSDSSEFVKYTKDINKMFNSFIIHKKR